MNINTWIIVSSVVAFVLVVRLIKDIRTDNRLKAVLKSLFKEGVPIEYISSGDYRIWRKLSDTLLEIVRVDEDGEDLPGILKVKVPVRFSNRIEVGCVYLLHYEPHHHEICFFWDKNTKSAGSELNNREEIPRYNRLLAKIGW